MNTVLRAAGYRAMPWKNGGGTTHEIALEADPSRPGHPLWRLSIATIGHDGPFSDFTGYDRTIVAVDGKGAELTFEGGATTRLDRSHGSVSFPGEVRVRCHLLDGPVRDFNVMTRRDRFIHRIAFARAREGARLSGGEASFLVILQGTATVDGEVAASLDTILLAPGSPGVTAGASGVHACIVSLAGVSSATGY